MLKVPVNFTDEELVTVLVADDEAVSGNNTQCSVDNNNINNSNDNINNNSNGGNKYLLTCGLLIRLRTGLLRVKKRTVWKPSQRIGSDAMNFLRLLRAFVISPDRTLQRFQNSSSISDGCCSQLLWDVAQELNVKSTNLSRLLTLQLLEHPLLLQLRSNETTSAAITTVVAATAVEGAVRMQYRLLFRSDFVSAVKSFHDSLERPIATDNHKPIEAITAVASGTIDTVTATATTASGATDEDVTTTAAASESAEVKSQHSPQRLLLLQQLASLPRERCCGCGGWRHVFCGCCGGRRMPAAAPLLPPPVQLPFDVLLLLHWRESLHHCTGIHAAAMCSSGEVSCAHWEKVATAECSTIPLQLLQQQQPQQQQPQQQQLQQQQQQQQQHHQQQHQLQQQQQQQQHHQQQQQQQRDVICGRKEPALGEILPFALNLNSDFNGGAATAATASTLKGRDINSMIHDLCSGNSTSSNSNSNSSDSNSSNNNSNSFNDSNSSDIGTSFSVLRANGGWREIVASLRADRDVLLFPSDHATPAAAFPWHRQQRQQQPQQQQQQDSDEGSCNSNSGNSNNCISNSCIDSNNSSSGNSSGSSSGEATKRWRLVVLEASWNYGATMAQQLQQHRAQLHLPPLQQVTLPADVIGQYWKFQRVGKSAVSTIEAIAHAAAAAGLADAALQSLLLLFQLQQLRVRSSVEAGAKPPRALQVRGVGVGGWRAFTDSVVAATVAATAESSADEATAGASTDGGRTVYYTAVEVAAALGVVDDLNSSSSSSGSDCCEGVGIGISFTAIADSSFH